MAETPSLSGEKPLYCPQCKQLLEITANKCVCNACSCNYKITDGIPQFVNDEKPAESFDSSSFEFLFEMEQRHFWHVGRREIILDILKKIPDINQARILEVGCGNGSVLAFLKQHKLNVEGGDIFVEGLKFCRKRAGELPLYQIDIMSLPFISSYDVIGMFDVLEHIKDDKKALSEVNRALEPGGKILLTVPAHKFLWSYFDEASAHQRRYSRKEIIAKVEENGFIIRKASYYVSFLFPFFLGMRIIGKLTHRKRRADLSVSLETQTVPVINSLFLWTLRAEKFLLKHMNLPMGASLIILAEKK